MKKPETPETIVNRSSIKKDWALEMFQTERHHKHLIIKDQEGKFFWKTDPDIRKMVDITGLTKIWNLFDSLGMDRNNEMLRKMYRGMGYSLFGYWEVFYCPINNPFTYFYKPPVQK